MLKNAYTVIPLNMENKVREQGIPRDTFLDFSTDERLIKAIFEAKNQQDPTGQGMLILSVPWSAFDHFDALNFSDHEFDSVIPDVDDKFKSKNGNEYLWASRSGSFGYRGGLKAVNICKCHPSMIGEQEGLSPLIPVNDKTIFSTYLIEALIEIRRQSLGRKTNALLVAKNNNAFPYVQFDQQTISEYGILPLAELDEKIKNNSMTSVNIDTITDGEYSRYFRPGNDIASLEISNMTTDRDSRLFKVIDHVKKVLKEQQKQERRNKRDMA